MAITYVNVAATSGNKTTSWAVTIPACSAGDILIAVCVNRDSTADPTCTDTDSGGNLWAKILSRNNGTANASVWWKRATSGTGGKTLTLGSCTGSCAGGVVIYSGCSVGVAPYENATGETNASADESHAAITPTRNGSLVCLCTFNGTNDIAVDTQSSTSPGTLTERIDSLSTGGSDSSASFAAAVQTTAGTTGALTWAQVDAASQSIVFDILAALTALDATPQQTFTLTGVATGLTKASRLSASPQQTFALTGNAAILSHTLAALSASPNQTFALTGNATGLTRTTKLSASPQQSFVLSGIDAGLKTARLLTTEQAAFALSGNAATLTYTPAEGKSITASVTPFTLTGNDVGLTVARKLSASPNQSFGLTANDVGLRASRKIVTEQGIFTLTGTVSDLKAARLLLADVTEFDLTGNDATLDYVHYPRIAGRTLNKLGVPVPDCEIYIFRTDTKALVAQGMTGSDGRYEILLTDDTLDYFIVTYKTALVNVGAISRRDVRAA